MIILSFEYLNRILLKSAIMFIFNIISESLEKFDVIIIIMMESF